MVVKKKIWCYFILWLSVGSTYAQYTSLLGRFEVDEIRGCVPLTVNLTSLLGNSCSPTKPCAVDFENNGQAQQNLFSHTYTVPGHYKLSVLYQAIGIDEITIIVEENTLPDIQLYTCANLGISLQIKNPSYDRYRIDFDDGKGAIFRPKNNPSASTAYALPGNKQIRVRVVYIDAKDNCNVVVQPFNALQKLDPPVITGLKALDKNRIRIEVSTQNNRQYTVAISTDGIRSFQASTQAIFTPSSVILSALNTDDHYYCFRTTIHDPCANTSISSNLLCSSRFNLTTVDGQNELVWNTDLKNSQHLTIERNGNAYAKIPASSSQFHDTNVICKTSYCYRLVHQYLTGEQSVSVEKCGISFTKITPPPINNVSIEIMGQHTLLTWIPQSITSLTPLYTIFYSYNKINFTRAGISLQPSFDDQSYNPNRKTGYRIGYTDACDNTSETGAITFPIMLQGSIDKDNVAMLTWNTYIGWKKGVKKYVIEQYSPLGKLLKRVDNGTSTYFTDKELNFSHQLITYRILAEANESGITPSFSNVLPLSKEVKLISPTAFTPNGDGLNDNFTITGHYIKKFNLWIFNRWGELIFHAITNEVWRGTTANTEAPEGTYTWLADIEDFNGKNSEHYGKILLLRSHSP